MSRSRWFLSVACLAFVLLALVPGAASAQRGARVVSYSEDSNPSGASLVRSAFDLGRGAWGWLQSMVGEEHGQIVPAVPPPPGTLTDPPADPSDPVVPGEPEDPGVPVEPAP